MPVLTHVDDRGFIRITLSGPWPGIDDLRRLRKDLDARGEGNNVLADMRGVTGEFPYSEQIRSAVSMVRESKTSAARRRAVLVGSDVQFGIARMFQSLLPGEVEVFRDEEAAVAWLIEG